MSILDGLIGRAVARLPSRRGPSLAGVDAEGMLIANEATISRRRWEEVECIAAASAAGLVGETAVLAIQFHDGPALVVPETDERWDELTEALFRLPGAQTATEWKLRLLAAPDQAVEVYRRG